MQCPRGSRHERKHQHRTGSRPRERSERAPAVTTGRRHERKRDQSLLMAAEVAGHGYAEPNGSPAAEAQGKGVVSKGSRWAPRAGGEFA